MILGKDTKAFTLADTVGFGVKTAIKLPLIIEANKSVCLQSVGTALNGNTLCSTFGAHAS
jgi:hypothetical protein